MAAADNEVQLDNPNPNFVPAFAAAVEKKTLGEFNKDFPFVDENEFWNTVVDAVKYANERRKEWDLFLVKDGTGYLTNPKTNQTVSSHGYAEIPQDLEKLKPRIKQHRVEETGSDNNTPIIKYGITLGLACSYIRRGPGRSIELYNENPKTDLITYDELKGYAEKWRSKVTNSVGAGAGAGAKAS